VPARLLQIRESISLKSAINGQQILENLPGGARMEWFFSQPPSERERLSSWC